ncbi:zinc finger protein 250-like isoform X2 [Spea bombifrons]|uniref:zinc finger protein 250-like isoform X2 n=1 Tax=Spea bombifrons TaxID=233779 RepID=UPI00234B53AF|nr:zinc finger protein 250-like isoform X2 [Spea bombifrons]
MALAKGPMKFNDVAVLFTEEEWSILSDQQRALYMEVMKENYEHFIFLGYEVPVILSLLQDSSRQLIGSGSRSSALIPLAGRVSAASLQSNGKSHSESIAAGPQETAADSLQNGGDSSHDENHGDLSPPPHNRNLRKRRQYFCSECESCFKHSSALEAHRRIHNGDKPHQCDVCKETFSYRSALIVHRRQHPVPEPPHNAQIVTPAMTALVAKPLLAVGGAPAITLTVRDVPTITPSETTNSHGIPSVGEKPLKCLYCDKRFNDPAILEAHHRIHTGKLAYPCTMCEASFSKPSLLAAHNNTHKEGKPFQCDQCDKNFNDQTLLVAHKRTHTGDKPHRCSHCKKWFLNRAALVSHEECHVKVKPYKCRHCDKSFNDKSLLVTHEGVHTDTKPLKCTQCSESFFLRTQLIAHQLIHESEKPFPCSQCDRRFNKKETLLAHIRVHNLQTTQQTAKPRRQ